MKPVTFDNCVAINYNNVQDTLVVYMANIESCWLFFKESSKKEVIRNTARAAQEMRKSKSFAAANVLDRFSHKLLKRYKEEQRTS